MAYNADSVKTLNSGYQRSTRLQTTGKLHKGHGVAAATASIPSKFQTIVTDGSDKKGFNAKSKRFNYDANLGEFPGPGRYVGHQPTDFHKPLSKKGMGNGFASKSRRSWKIKMTAGPPSSRYMLPSMLRTTNDFNQSISSSSFSQPIAVHRDKVEVQPAPNQYNVLQSKSHIDKHFGSQANAAFKSKSRRQNLNQLQENFPSPCQYSVSDSLVKDAPKIPYSSFKSSSLRKMAETPPPNPGPGHYRPNEPIEGTKKLILPPRKHYLCISAPAMPMPASLPDPGPGTYELVNYEGPSKHYMSSSVFVSNTSRWSGQVINRDYPGPASYRPQLHMGRQSFLYNSANKFV